MLTKTQINNLPTAAFESVYALRWHVSTAYGKTLTEAACAKILNQYRRK